MRKIVILISFYFLFTSNTYSQIESIENAIVSNVANCEKQAHLRLQIIYKNKINEKPRIRWKHNDQYLNENEKYDILVTEYGQYTCELKVGNNVTYSNSYTLNNFNNKVILLPNTTILTNSPDQGYFKTDCQKATETNNAVLYAENYDYFSLTNGKLPISDSLTKIYNWYVNDSLQNSHDSKLLMTTNFDKTSIKLNVVLGNCSYFSKNNIISKNTNLQIQNLKLSYESCFGDSADIGNVRTVIPAKLEWYKDGLLLHSSGQENNFKPEHFYFRTNQPGKYIVRAVHSIGYDEVKKEYLYSSNSCIIQSDTINVVLKNTIKPDKLKYGIRDFELKLCDSPNLILKTSKKIENLKWYHDDILLSKENSYDSLTGFEVNHYLKLMKPGNYHAVFNINQECNAKSNTFYYNGKPKLNFEKYENCDLKYLKVVVNNWEIKDFEKRFKFIWKLNNEIIPNENDSKLPIIKSGEYQAKAVQTNGDCILDSELIKLEIPSENLSLNISDSLKLCVGKTANLNLKDSTSNSKILVWFKNNDFFQKSIQNLIVDSPGIYKCLFKESNCGDYLFSNQVIVKTNPLPNAILSGSSIIDFSKSANLKFDLSGQNPWIIKLNTGEEFTIEKTPYYLSVSPIFDKKYSISSVKNICGLGISSGEAEIKVVILADEKWVEKPNEIKFSPIPFDNETEIEIKSEKAKFVKIELYNIVGELIRKYETEFFNKKAHQIIKFDDLISGLFILKIEVAGKLFYKQLLKR
jgi:hypothetical protein